MILALSLLQQHSVLQKQKKPVKQHLTSIAAMVTVITTGSNSGGPTTALDVTQDKHCL